MKRALMILACVLVFSTLAAIAAFRFSLGPVSDKSAPSYFRVKKGETIAEILERLEEDGIIKSATFVRMHYRLFGGDKQKLRRGTFKVDPSMTGDAILERLLSEEPVRQMVLIREGLWASEVAAKLDARGVADKAEVLAIEKAPKLLGSLPPFIVPGKGLEGYLYPETYDFPPLLGAKEALRRMLDQFAKEVYVPLGKPDPIKLRSWVIIGSMVELEAKVEKERPRIAGVIYNRLMKGMPLQIDATVVYGLGVRRKLTQKDYLLTHPYNTYRLNALPPGPICSPRASSVFAAAKPEKHHFFYYVAMPDGTHKFATTYQQHLHNVNLSRTAYAQKKAASG